MIAHSKKILLILSHLAMGALGFAAGIYTLPILIAPDSPSASEIDALSTQAIYQGQFRRDLKDSDRFHWGEGDVYVGEKVISFKGELAPGPDYKLYLSPVYLETEDEFEKHKPKMLQVADVRVFKNFIVVLPDGVNLEQYNSVIIWCETFDEFVTAAKYR